MVACLYHSLVHIYFAASLYYELKAADTQPHFTAARLTPCSLGVVGLSFENLVRVKVSTDLCTTVFQGPPTQALLDQFTKDGLSFIQSFIATYSSSEKIQFASPAR